MFRKVLFRVVSLMVFLLMVNVNYASAKTLEKHPTFKSIESSSGGTTTLISVASDGDFGNAASYAYSISSDGRYITFDSSASNLVPNDTNSRADAFLLDRHTGNIRMISISTSGTQGNGASTYGTTSDDGNIIAFTSYANDLVPNDNNDGPDIFVHDKENGTTKNGFYFIFW